MRQTTLYILTGFITLSFIGNCVLCGPCSGSEFVGPNDVNNLSVISPDSNDINTTTLLTSSLYTIPCCGVISRWEVAAEGEGKVRLQVWRRVAANSNTFYFLGQNGWQKSTSIVEVVSRGITASAQVQVNTGDYVAIYHFNAATTRYDTCDPVSSPSTCSQSVLYANDIPGSELNEGFTYTFNVLQSTVLSSSTVRNYAAKAYLTTKSQVTCANETRSISDTLETGGHVTNISTENMDVYSSGSVFAIESIQPSLPVTINAQTGQITTTGTLTPSFPDTTYDIHIRVTDVCSQTNTCVLTLVVINEPKPIVFENLPASEETIQASDVTVDLFTVQLARQREVDDVACLIQSHTPVVNDVSFTVQNVSSTAYKILMTTSQSYKETDTDTIVLTIYCWNNQGFNNQSTLAVVFKPGNKNGNSFLVIGLLLTVLVVSAFIAATAVLIKMKGKRNGFSSTSSGNNRRNVKPDVIPKPIFIEPAHTTFSNINKNTGHHKRTKGRISPSTSGYTSGFETSPNSSFGSETSPTSISPLEFVESPNEGSKGLVETTKKTVFNTSTHSESTRFYFRKKPWRP